MATTKKKKKAVRARGPYRRELTGPVRYVRTEGDVDDAVLAAYPNRTASDAYRAALSAWLKFRAYLAANPPTNAELDEHLAEVIR